MKPALILIRIIVAVCMISASGFLIFYAEGFTWQYIKADMRFSRVWTAAKDHPSAVAHASLATAEEFRAIVKETAAKGQTAALATSGLFAGLSVLAVIAGNLLQDEIRDAAGREIEDPPANVWLE